MRQAIETKYLGPTNHRGGRVLAGCVAGRITVPWRHELNPEANHALAAKLLMNKLDWTGRLVGGGLPNGRGYAFVVLDGE